MSIVNPLLVLNNEVMNFDWRIPFSGYVVDRQNRCEGTDVVIFQEDDDEKKCTGLRGNDLIIEFLFIFIH